MKKLFYLFAVAVVAISLASCDKKKDEPTPTPTPTPVAGDTIVITHDAYYWKDATAAAGWWQIMDSTATYTLSLSNLGGRTKPAGEYAMEDMDDDYSFYVDEAKHDTLHFVDCNLTVAVSADAREVKVNGTLDATTGDVFIVNLTWTKPADPIAAKELEIVIPEAELADFTAEDGVFQVYGSTADKEWSVSLTVNSNTVVGTYTLDDLYALGKYSYILNPEEKYEPEYFSADIKVEAGAEEGFYNVSADVLCYDSVLYKITMTVAPFEADSTAEATLAGTLIDYTAAIGVFQVQSEAMEDGGAFYLTLDAADIEGTFTEEDANAKYGAALVYSDSEYYNVKAMELKGEISGENYVLSGTIACANKVEYTVTITCPIEEEMEAGAPLRKALKKNAKKATVQLVSAKPTSRK